SLLARARPHARRRRRALQHEPADHGAGPARAAGHPHARPASQPRERAPPRRARARAGPLRPRAAAARSRRAEGVRGRARGVTQRWEPEGEARGDVALLHGVMALADTWWRIGPALAARGWRVAAFDLAGHA